MHGGTRRGNDKSYPSAQETRLFEHAGNLMNETDRWKKSILPIMQIIQFTKAEGAQNDFVIVDDRRGELSTDVRIRFTQLISHRRKGAGSDGAIFIDASTTHDFIMAFFNPDGSVGSMCGNGGRCAALFAQRNGIAVSPMRFEVLGRTYTAVVQGSNITLSFPAPASIDEPIELQTVAGAIPLRFVDTGAPHAVIFAEDLPSTLQADYDTLDMRGIGSLVRWHAHFAPVGVNVNVVRYNSGGLDIRTFEKGVEDETEACGTGALAAAITAHLRLGLDLPLMLRTHGGDILRVGFNPDTPLHSTERSSYVRDLFLEGPAHLVYDGCYALEESMKDEC